MSEHLAREVQVAEQRERRLSTLEGDLRLQRDVTTLQLDGLRKDLESGLADIKSTLKSIEGQTTKTNGSVADAFREIEAVKVTGRETGSRLADVEADVVELDGKVASAMTELHATAGERHDKDLRVDGRWDVIKAELRWVAVGWATLGGPSLVAALLLAYLKGWIG